MNPYQSRAKAAHAAKLSKRLPNGVPALITKDYENKRILLELPAVPHKELKKQLFSRGFRWNSEVKRWQAPLNESTKFSAKYIMAWYSLDQALENVRKEKQDEH
jgi:hypothetical protein